jgi:hypothetical protein
MSLSSNSNPHGQSSSSSNSNAPQRQSFTLRCDRPRYDGGVEFDLERYLGSKLQPSYATFKRRQQQAVAPSATRPVTPSVTPVAESVETPVVQAESLTAASMMEKPVTVSVQLPESSLMVQWCARHLPELLWVGMMLKLAFKGPLEMLFAMAGILSGLSAWSLGATQSTQPEAAQELRQIETMLTDCWQLLGQSVLTMLRTPRQLLQFMHL